MYLNSFQSQTGAELLQTQFDSSKILRSKDLVVWSKTCYVVCSDALEAWLGVMVV
jgi:hypothetical protein